MNSEIYPVSINGTLTLHEFLLSISNQFLRVCMRTSVYTSAKTYFALKKRIYSSYKLSEIPSASNWSNALTIDPLVINCNDLLPH